MPLGDYVAGLAIFAAVAAAAGCTATVVVRRRLAHLRGSARATAWAIAFLGALVAAHLLPGVLGVLSRWSALLAALAIAAVAAIRVRPARPAAAAGAEPPAPRSGPGSAALAGIGCAAVAVAYLAAAWRTSVTPSQSVDTLTFHLPNIGRWIQGGSLWQVDQFVPVWTLGNYPQNGDVAFLAAVLPWRNDAFAELLNFGFAALLALAVYALGRELRAPRATAALAAALVAAVPLTARLAAQTTMPDLFLAASFAAGTLFLVRSFRSGLRSELVLAGVALGLAFGSKWNGVTTVAVAVAVWAAAWLVARRPAPRLLRSGALLGGAVAAAGGFWLLRNWVMSGNPVIPVRVHLLGATVFGSPPDEIRACTGWRIVDYAGDGHVWSTYFWPSWRDFLGPAALVALVGAALAACLAMARRGRSPLARRERAAVGAVVVCALLLVVAYALTPYSALGPKGLPVVTGRQARYLLPALALAAAATAWGAGRLRRLRPLAELVLVAAVLDGLRLSFDLPRGTLAGAALALALAAAAALAVRALAGRRPRRRAVLALAGAAALALAAGAGWVRQRDFNRGRYRGQDAAIEWIARNAPAGHRVALAGSWGGSALVPVLPALGPRFHNHVGYPARSVQRVLRPYTERAAWAAAVRRGGYDLMLVGNDRPLGPRDCFVPGSRTDWNAWARQSGFRVLARSRGLTLYGVRPG